MYILKNTSVKFEKGKILTSEMLDALNHQSENYIRQYESYPTGILFGLDLIRDKDRIFICRGAVKKNGKIYFLEENINISDMIKNLEKYPEFESGSKCILILREIQDIRETESITSNCLEAKIIKAEELFESDFVLCEFEYARNSVNLLADEKLNPYENIERTIKGTMYIGLADTKYSISGESTYHPFLFSLIAELIESKSNKTYFDLFILSMIYNNKVISKKTMVLYIKHFGGLIKNNSEAELFMSFANIIRDSKDSFETKSETVSEHHENNKRKNPRYIEC